MPRALPEQALGNTAVVTAFAVGVLAPDLGFFPGGPFEFSRRAHHESTGDFARALLAGARSLEEEAFALGWALHVFTDLATHPYVNAQAADNGRSSPGRNRNELWHKRLEWGFDCHVITAGEASGIPERVDALVSSKPGGHFLTVAAEVFGDDADAGDLRHGWVAMTSWVRRLLSIFLWTGNARLGQSRFSTGLRVRPVRSVVRGFGRALALVERWDDAAAVARPHEPDAEFIQSMQRLGDEALERYCAALEDRFASMPNLDLDTGAAIPRIRAVGR